MGGTSRDVTQLLQRMRSGDAGAGDELFAALAQELRGLAEGQMRRQPPGHTLQTTALIHEAWLRLVGEDVAEFAGREHFLAVAARAMRSVLVDHARRRKAEKRAPGARRVTLADDLVGATATPELLLQLEEALQRLSALDPELERVAELRIFGGLSCAEVSAATGTPLRTVERAWHTARAWIQRALGTGGDGGG